MTMFKKVFGSQMAAATDPQDEATSIPASTPPDPEPAPLRKGPPSQPMFVPVPQVLSMKEEEIAAQRAEKEAERKERLRQEEEAQKRPEAAPARPAGPPPAMAPKASFAPPTTPVNMAPETPSAPPVPQPTSQPARPAGRARTRLLGFGADAEGPSNPMAGPVATPAARQFPTGWIVVIAGPGRGHAFPLYTGVSSLGRDEGQMIALSFGDMTISRENHAAIAYDEEDHQFYVGHGGKSNIIRLNGRPVLSTEPLSHGDTLRIGETVLRFAAFCSTEFNWATETND